MDKVSPWKHQRALDTIYLKTFRLQGKARSAAEKWRLLSLLWSCTDDAALQLWGFSFLLFWQVHWLSLFMNLLALHQSQWPRLGPWVLNVNSNDSGWHEVLRVSSKWVEAFRDEFRHTFGPSITSRAKHIRKTPKQNSRDSEQPRIKTNLPKLKRQTHRGTNCTSEWELHIHSVDILHQSGESSWQLSALYWKTYHS